MNGFPRYLLTALSCSVLFVDRADAVEGAAVSQIPTISLKHLSKKSKQWSVDHGLASDRVDSILQTPSGHIWVSGGNAVARLYGGEFQRYNATELIGQHIGSLDHMVADQHGRIWMFARNKLIVTHDRGRFSLYHPEDSTQFGHVKAAASDKHNDKGVVVFTDDNQITKLYQLRPSGWKLLKVFHKSMGKVISADFDEQGTLWFVNGGRDLFKFDTDRLVVTRVSNDKETGKGSFSTLFRHPHGHLLVADRRGIYTLGSEVMTSLRLFPEPLPFEMISHINVMDRDGNLWMSGGVKRLHLSRENGELHHVSLKGTGFSPPIYHLLLDRSDTLWLGSFNGLFQIAYSPCVTWKLEKDSVPYRFVSSSEDGEGRMWFSCIGAVSYLDPYDDQLRVSSQRQVSNSGLVLGHPDGGAYAINRNGGLFRHYPDGQTDLGVRLKMENPRHQLSTSGAVMTPQGDHWVATHHGLYHRKSGEAEQGYHQVVIPQGGANAAISCLVLGNRQDLYAAVRSRGIFRLHLKTMKWEKVSHDDHAAAKRVYCMDVDNENRLWALNKHLKIVMGFVGSESLQASLDELNLGHMDLWGMVTDLNGGLWITTRVNGVAHASVKDLIQVMRNGGGDELLYQWFDQRSGLGSKAGSYVPNGILRKSDGSIWISSSKGVSVIQPELWAINRKRMEAFPVSIENCLLDELAVATSSDQSELHHAKIQETINVLVPPGTKKVEIHYSSINNTFLGENQYRYRLTGYDDDWVFAGSTTKASYRNLPPKQYVFEVSIQQPDGSWGSQVSSITLNVKGYWWQKSWLQFLFAVGVILFFLLIFRKRIQYLKRREATQEAFSKQLLESQEDERKRIAGELHDSLGQDLLLIKNTTERVKRDVDDNGSIKERLDDISEIASHAISEARAITANLRPVELDRLGLRIAVQSMLDRIEESSDVVIESSISELEKKWPEKDEINIYRVIQEGLNNSIKHAKASLISVRVTTSLHKLFIEIKDDGCGFDIDSSQSYKSNGLGLTGLDERVKILTGKLSLTSERGKGVTLLIELPIPTAE